MTGVKDSIVVEYLYLFINKSFIIEMTTIFIA